MAYICCTAWPYEWSIFRLCLGEHFSKHILLLFQGNAYGYAYGTSGRRSQGGYHRGREEAQVEDTRLKNLIRDTKNAMNNTRQFWTQLPYELCRYEMATLPADLFGVIGHFT